MPTSLYVCAHLTTFYIFLIFCSKGTFLHSLVEEGLEKESIVKSSRESRDLTCKIEQTKLQIYDSASSRRQRLCQRSLYFLRYEQIMSKENRVFGIILECIVRISI